MNRSPFASRSELRLFAQQRKTFYRPIVVARNSGGLQKNSKWLAHKLYLLLDPGVGGDGRNSAQRNVSYHYQHCGRTMDNGAVGSAWDHAGESRDNDVVECENVT